MHVEVALSRRRRHQRCISDSHSWRGSWGNSSGFVRTVTEYVALSPQVAVQAQAALAFASANEAETKNKAERVMLVRCVMVEFAV